LAAGWLPFPASFFLSAAIAGNPTHATQTKHANSNEHSFFILNTSPS
jgi:hypothetical protein